MLFNQIHCSFLDTLQLKVENIFPALTCSFIPWLAAAWSRLQAAAYLCGNFSVASYVLYPPVPCPLIPCPPVPCPPGAPRHAHEATRLVTRSLINVVIVRTSIFAWHVRSTESF